MEFKLYTLTKTSIKEVDLFISNYPLDDRSLDSILDNIYLYKDQDSALLNAIMDSSYKAIESFLDDDPNRWINFSNLIISNEPIVNNKISYVDELPYTLQQIIQNSLFKITDLSNKNSIYSILVNYLDYKYIKPYDYFYMISNDYDSLTWKLMNMLSDYFPNKTYEEKSTPRKFVDYILEGTDYTFRDIPSIIYNVISREDTQEYTNLKDYLNNIVLDKNLTYRTFKSSKYYNIEEYKVYEDSIDFNIYVYKNDKIDMIPVNFKINKQLTNRLQSEQNVSVMLDVIKECRLKNVLTQAMRKKNIDQSKVIKFLGKDRYKWDVFAEAILKGKENKYLKDLLDNDMFMISRKLLSRPNTIANISDEAKLKCNRDVVPYLLNKKINLYVLGFLVYDLLSDTFRENLNYMNKSQYYLTKVNELKRPIEDRNVQKSFIKDLLKEEGIKSPNSNVTYNMFSILCIDYYKLSNNLSQYNNFGEYWKYTINKLGGINRLSLIIYEEDLFRMSIKLMK